MTLFNNTKKLVTIKILNREVYEKEVCYGNINTFICVDVRIL